MPPVARAEEAATAAAAQTVSPSTAPSQLHPPAPPHSPQPPTQLCSPPGAGPPPPIATGRWPLLSRRPRVAHPAAAGRAFPAAAPVPIKGPRHGMAHSPAGWGGGGGKTTAAMGRARPVGARAQQTASIGTRRYRNQRRRRPGHAVAQGQGEGRRRRTRRDCPRGQPPPRAGRRLPGRRRLVAAEGVEADSLGPMGRAPWDRPSEADPATRLPRTPYFQ